MSRIFTNGSTGDLGLMAPPVVARHMKVFFPFRFDTANQCLWRRGDTGQEERILLTPKAFAVLDHLVEHAGRLVTHNELLEAVWPDTVVEPQAVKRYVVAVRSALGDRPGAERNTLLIGFCEHVGLIAGLVLAAMVAALRLGL
jgi:DNA-binding response OmpR family regulator